MELRKRYSNYERGLKMSNEGFRNVPGVPDGWELVRVGRPVVGDFVVHTDGRVLEHGKDRCVRMNENYPIIRKIEQPAKYRPFASADEFRPHRDRWTMHPNEPDKRFRPGDYNNDGVWGHDRRFYGYQNLFEGGALFDDGTPFGVRIDD